ncbi:TIGR02680 family protein [Streptomyces violaceorubidus]
MVEAARSAVDPWLAALGAERDDLSLTVRERETEQDRLRQQREDWERHTDPEPPPPPHRTAPRTPGTGAPLYRLVDFAHDVGPDARAGLEAALEASGLLDAWVRADGTVLDPATRDTLLVPGAPVPGATLAQVLRPVAAPDSGVTAEQVERVLGAVALAAGETLTGEPGSVGVDLHVGADVDVERAELHTAIGTDGSWRLGIVRGRHTKEAAEYVGAEVRAETRRRALAELDRRLLDLEKELVERRRGLRILTEHRDLVADTLRRPPPARGLTDAWARTAEAERAAETLASQAYTAAREAEQARARAVVARREAEATASAHDLPADPAALQTVRLALDRLGQGAQRLRRRVGAVLSAADGHRAGRADYERAESARREAESDYAEPLTRLEAARRTVRALEEALGATEQEILAREAETKRRLDAVGRQLPGARRDMADIHDRRVRAERGGADASRGTRHARGRGAGMRQETADGPFPAGRCLRGAGLDADADRRARDCR